MRDKFYRGMLWGLSLPVVFGQTAVDLRTQSRNVDFSGAVSTKPFQTGTTFPATCAIGQMLFLTSAPAGSNVFGCAAPNIWTLESGGGGSGAGGVASQLGDFLTTRTNSTTLTIGAACGATTPCNVRYGGQVYSFVTGGVATVIAGTGTAYIYVSSSGVLTVGHNLTLTCSIGCTAVGGVTSFPLDAIPLFIWTSTGGAWDATGGADERAFLSSQLLVAGAGIQLTQSPGQNIVLTDPTVVGLRVAAPATSSSPLRDRNLGCNKRILLCLREYQYMGALGTVVVLGMRDGAKMQIMKPSLAIALGFAFGTNSYAITTVSVSKSDLTATQAIIRVKTDQPGFCSYRVSEGGSFTALVNDVNPTLFTGANSDARSGSILTGMSATRTGGVNTGSEHVFVAGTRTSSKASDGKFYSRALQTNTLHWVGVTCGTNSEVSTTFTTLNIPLGDNQPELMPFNTSAFGNIAVPSINWTNRSVVYNDPIMGTQLHRMTDPADDALYAAANTFAYGVSLNGHWTNPANAISASQSSLATCDTSSSCTTTDTLALVAVIPRTVTNFATNGAWDPTLSYLDFLVRMWGSGTDSNAVNRTVAVCWSVDDQTCFTSTQSIVLPQGTPAFAGTAPRSWSVQSPWSGVSSLGLTNIVVTSGTAKVNFPSTHGLSVGGQICINGIAQHSVTTAQGGNGLNGCFTIASVPTSSSLTFASNAAAGTYTDGELIASTGFPQAQWASWGTPPFHSSVGERTNGTVTSASGAVTLSSGGSISVFDPAWPTGTKIFVNGSSPTCTNNLCTVSKVTDAQHLTLVENLTINSASWNSANFSLLVKKTTATGAVSVSAGYDFVYSAQFNAGLDGSGNICNSNLVTISVDANGNAISPSVQGYLCTGSVVPINNAQPIYVFIPATGETRLIARGFQPLVNDYRSWVGWHPTNGNCWFVNFPGQSIFQACYGGDYRALTPGFPQNGTEPDTPEQTIYTDIFAGNSIASQIAACQANGTCNNGINTALFGSSPQPPQTGAAIQGSYMVLCQGVPGGTQDSPGYMTLWNVSSTPATLAWAAYSFDQFPVGYAGIHACINFGTGQFNIASLNGNIGQLSGPLRGPWQQTPTLYNKGSGFSSNTAVVLTDGFECPAGLSPQWQALGAKPIASGGVARCLEFIVPGDFCSHNATPAESTAFPCPWNSLVPFFSLIKPIGEGDELADSTSGAVSHDEKMLVVKVTRNSLTNIDLLVFRYSQQSQTPNSGFTCGSYAASEWNHANGWTMYALPYHGCFGSTYWINALDSTHSYTAENPSILGVHSDFGQGSSGYTYIEGGFYLARTTRTDASTDWPASKHRHARESDVWLAATS